MKRNKLQKTAFSVICVVLAVVMVLSLVITVLPARAVDRDRSRAARGKAGDSLKSSSRNRSRSLQGLTDNQTLIVLPQGGAR